ncbi:MAG: gamma-glutamyltransferase family protein [Actinomycetota bacterium]|nr:gamma-glutamyltransferase family protein [Actinomycetota bacterium]
MLPTGVAAGHPATVAAGIEILEDGGSAADAAGAACLASCVAETVMTGLLGGGHAIHWDGRHAQNLDCFVDAPSGAGAAPVELHVPFGEELVHYAVGPGTCAVPGLPRGLGALHERFGRLPWARVVEPAIRLAREDVVMPPAHAACLAMLAPVFTMRPDGERIYAPAGRPLEAGERLAQPGLVMALEAVATEGADAVYEGSIAERLLAIVGVPVVADDLRRYEARWAEPVASTYAGLRFLTRGGFAGVAEALDRLPTLRGLSGRERVPALLDALEGPSIEGHTTNLVTADAGGNVCVLTSSLGLGTGDFLSGLDLQLNSMLGETDLVREPLRPGERMASMMAPSLAVGSAGLELAIGAAGGTRLRTALVGVVAGILDERLDPADAVERPRFHRAGDVVNAEPGVDEQALEELEAAGLLVRRWPAQHHYFGGVSLLARAGAAGDPRRSGHAATAR